MTPKELVEEYKRSGKFDRLRREAMESFLASDHSATLTRRVDQIASDALQKVDHAHFVRQGQDALLGTIMNDLDRQFKGRRVPTQHRPRGFKYNKSPRTRQARPDITGARG